MLQDAGSAGSLVRIIGVMWPCGQFRERHGTDDHFLGQLIRTESGEVYDDARVDQTTKAYVTRHG